MAETKKTAVAKPTAKAVATKEADTKKEEVKVEAAVKEAPKTETKKPAAKKAPAKKTTAKKTTDKAAAKKTTTKTTAAKASKAEVVLQFAGKTYSTEDLIKIAKDVWQYDLNRDLKDFKTVSIYVKPEEKLAYYVVNDEVSGSFAI